MAKHGQAAAVEQAEQEKKEQNAVTVQRDGLAVHYFTSDDRGFPYRSCCYIAPDATMATDGYMLARVAHSPVPGFRPVLVPAGACEKVLQLLGNRKKILHQKVTVSHDDNGNVTFAYQGANSGTFTVRAVDETYPECEKLFADRGAPVITFRVSVERLKTLAKFLSTLDLAPTNGDVSVIVHWWGSEHTPLHIQGQTRSGQRVDVLMMPNRPQPGDEIYTAPGQVDSEG